MRQGTRLMWGCVLVLPLAIACGGNSATNTRNGEGLNDESARVATNDGPGAGTVGTTGAASPGASDRPAQNSGLNDAGAFVAAMLADGQSEVALGRLASERAGNAQVKALAQEIAGDHAKANDELAAIASKLNIKADAPDAAHQAMQDRLTKMSGAEFDREYVNAMITAHQSAVEQLKAMSGSDMPSHHEQADGGRSAAGGSATSGSASGTSRPGSPTSSTRAGVAPEAGSIGPGSMAGTRGVDPNGSPAVHAWAAQVMPVVQKHLDRAIALQRTVGGAAGAAKRPTQ